MSRCKIYLVNGQVQNLSNQQARVECIQYTQRNRKKSRWRQSLGWPKFLKLSNFKTVGSNKWAGRNFSQELINEQALIRMYRAEKSSHIYKRACPFIKQVWVLDPQMLSHLQLTFHREHGSESQAFEYWYREFSKFPHFINSRVLKHPKSSQMQALTKNITFIIT